MINMIEVHDVEAIPVVRKQTYDQYDIEHYVGTFPVVHEVNSSIIYVLFYRNGPCIMCYIIFVIRLFLFYRNGSCILCYILFVIRLFLVTETTLSQI
jgi:hypothetical protein